MDKYLLNVLDSISGGIIILNSQLQVEFWNHQVEQLSGIAKSEATNKSIFEIFVNMNKAYYKSALENTINKGNQYFFSAKLHKNIIPGKRNINFKINRINRNAEHFVLVELEDITNEFLRVQQLKEHVNELSLLNKALQEKEKEIQQLAYYDTLTGVANRTMFYSIAENFMANTDRSNTVLGLMFIDIDNFKTINDQYGHSAGDKILVEAAKILARSTRESDMVFRFGGDEFVILLQGIHENKSYKIISDRINKKNKKIKLEDGTEVAISMSIGISFYPSDGNTIDQLVLKADQAMYASKKSGGGQCLDCK